MADNGAVTRSERILALAASASRLGAIFQLVTTLSGTRTGLRPTLLLVALIPASTLLVVGWLRRRSVPATWAGLDAAAIAAVLALTGTPWLTGQAAGESPAYNFATIATTGFAVARWGLPAALGAAALLAAANLGTATASGSSYPLWNAIPDSATFLGICAVAWFLAWLLRTSAAAVDQQHAAALDRAATLARERERARQARMLEGQLLVTLEGVVDHPAVTPALRDQLRQETAWLREVVTAGPPPGEGALGAALRGLAAEKAAGGLRVEVTLPDREPDLPPEVAVALVEAAREALTNAAKHAGTGTAALAVRRHGGEWLVEVSDTGRGFDPVTTRARIGHTHSIRQRLADVGGRAEIESAPGSGTRVRLAVPATGVSA